jgi:hypothetical protein
MTSSNPKLGAGLHAATVYVSVGVSDQLPIPDSALMPAPNGSSANLVGATGEYLRVGDRHTLRRTGEHVDGRTVGWTGRRNPIAPWLGLCALVASDLGAPKTTRSEDHCWLPNRDQVSSSACQIGTSVSYWFQ